jgi:hypothetical protein
VVFTSRFLATEQNLRFLKAVHAETATERGPNRDTDVPFPAVLAVYPEGCFLHASRLDATVDPPLPAVPFVAPGVLECTHHHKTPLSLRNAFAFGRCPQSHNRKSQPGSPAGVASTHQNVPQVTVRWCTITFSRGLDTSTRDSSQARCQMTLE